MEVGERVPAEMRTSQQAEGNLSGSLLFIRHASSQMHVGDEIGRRQTWFNLARLPGELHAIAETVVSKLVPEFPFRDQ